MNKGLFVMLEGIDGAGKGIIGKVLIKLLNVNLIGEIPGSPDGRPGMTSTDTETTPNGRPGMTSTDTETTPNGRPGMINADSKIFDLDQYLKDKLTYPSLDDWKNYPIIASSEPTYAPVGRYIRQELTNKNQVYSSAALAQAYALDRQILYEKLILPALEQGKIIIQSRGFVSSIVYQNLGANNNGLPLETILNLPGNQVALQRVPDYVIIPQLKDAKQALERLLARTEKQDDSIFEKLDFLTKAQLKYQSDELREFLESRGSKVIYLDTSGTMEESERHTQKFFDKYLKDKI